MIGWLAMVLAAGPGSPAAPASPVRVDAAEVQYLYKDRKVIFVGAPLVRLTRDDAVLTCRRLVADDDGQGHIRHAVCRGNVKLTRGDRIATCETATYDDAAARVVCSGSPVLRQGPSVMRGTELIYDLVEDRMVLSHAKGTVVPRGDVVRTPARAKETAR